MDEIELYLRLVNEESLRNVATELIKNAKFRLKGGFSAASCPLPMLKKSITEFLKINFKNFPQILKNVYIDDNRQKNISTNLSAENFMRMMYCNNQPIDKGIGLLLAFFPGEITHYPWIIKNIAEGKHPFEFKWESENAIISAKELTLLLMLQEDHDLIQEQMLFYIEKWGQRTLLKYHALVLEIKKLTWQEIASNLRTYRQTCILEIDFYMVLLMAKMDMITMEMTEEDVKIFQSILLLISKKHYQMTQKSRMNSAQKIRKYRKIIHKKQTNIERQMSNVEQKNVNLSDKFEVVSKIIQDNTMTIEDLAEQNKVKEQQIVGYKQESEKNQSIIAGSTLYIAPDCQHMIDDSAKEKAIILLSEEDSPLFKWFFEDVTFMRNNEKVTKILSYLNNDTILEPIFINTIGVSQNNLLKITNKINNEKNKVFLIFASTPIECITEILKRL